MHRTILTNILKNIATSKKILFFAVLFFILASAVSFFDRGLGVGLFFIVFLTAITFAISLKSGTKDKETYIIFLITLLIHLFAVLFIHYTGFRPVGGGADYEGYHQNAVEVANRFSQGNFSLEGLYSNHYFPVLIGIIYIFTLPQMIVGQFFVAWLSALSVLLMYFLILEIGGSKKSAFLAGLAVGIYPSYLYFGSLLLKDTVVIPLVLAGLILEVRILKNFTGLKFLAFFITLTTLMHFRFYVGLALMFSFIVCWFLVSNSRAADRIIYGLAIIFLLGFAPQLLGLGYYGSKPLSSYLTKETIKTYREVVYAPSSDFTGPAVKKDALGKIVRADTPAENSLSQNADNAKDDFKAKPPDDAAKQPDDSGIGSSFVVSTGFENPFIFTKNYATSFTYSLFGPFPWQLRYKRHLLFLADMIPWYFLCGIAFYGIFKIIRKNGFGYFCRAYRFSLSLFVFSIMALGALSLFINNFGIIGRIRKPIYIVLLCIMALGFEVKYFNFPIKLSVFKREG